MNIEHTIDAMDCRFAFCVLALFLWTTDAFPDSELGNLCGKPLGSGRWMVKNDWVSCQKCEAGAYYERRQRKCQTCPGTFTNVLPNVRTSCKDARAVEKKEMRNTTNRATKEPGRGAIAGVKNSSLLDWSFDLVAGNSTSLSVRIESLPAIKKDAGDKAVGVSKERRKGFRNSKRRRRKRGKQGKKKRRRKTKYRAMRKNKVRRSGRLIAEKLEP